MSEYELFATIFSAFSLVIACIALGWNIFRDCIDRPKLKISIFIAEIYIPGKGNMPQVISVTIVNSGRKPAVIKGHGFSLKDKTQCIFPDIMHLFNGKKLEPYGMLDVTIPNTSLLELIKKSKQISNFFIYDTIGKKWYPKKKIIKSFIDSLKRKESELV